MDPARAPARPHERTLLFAAALIESAVAGSNFLCPVRSHAAAVSVEIEGVAGELQDAARAAVELREYEERDVSPAQIRRLFERADEQVATALEVFGHYHARVDGELHEEGSQAYRAVLHVVPGDPVIVREVHVAVQGPAGRQPQVRDAIEAFELEKGDRLDHRAYERSKSRIDTVLHATGFLDAKMLRHRVAVTRATNSARVDLVWDASERYRFGEVRFSQAQFSERFLQRFVPWPKGEFYSTDLLLTLQQRLIDADYFSSVAVTPDLKGVRERVVPLDVLLIPAKRTVYSASVYVGTDSGPGGRLGVERRWVNRRGHKLAADIRYSQRLEEVSTSYRIPKPGPQNRNYSFAMAYRDEETDTSRSRMAHLGATEVMDRWKGFTRTLGLQYLNGDFEIAGQPGSTNLMYAEGLLTRKREDDPYFPLSGHALMYGLRLAAESLLSDTSLVQLRAEAKWLQQVKKDGRVILRTALGAMVVDDFDALPPELRFFAGGDRSVRGFDYQQIGETNAEGGVIGGEYLAVASAEYEHYFLEDWGAAVFVDAGDAFISDFEANVGAGIGLRWKSPVGLLRLDVARPVASDLGGSWRIHLVIGPDL